MDKSFKSLIDSSKSILILLPQQPSFDQVAAGLSLFLSIKGGQKNVRIYSPTSMVVEFNRLVGVNKVSSEIGNKNLVVKFADYKPENIEKVSYDIENKEFRLTVIPKDGFTPPGQDQIILAYAGVAADAVILIGGTSDQEFPILSSKDFAGSKLVHIGAKEIALSQGRQVISFAKRASSTSEIVGSLIKESGLNLDSDIATNLFMGLEEGSQNFSNADTGAETFSLAAQLIKLGARRFSAKSAQRGNYPPGSIPGEEVKVEEAVAPKSWFEPKVYKGTSVS